MSLTDPIPHNASGDWRSRLAVIPAAIVMISVQLFLEQFRWGRVAEWLLALAMANSIAAAFFWSKRDQRWYWISILSIMTVQAVLIIVQGPAGLPEHLGKGFMAVVLWDAAATTFLFYWLAWLFDPDRSPRTQAGKVTEIVIYGLMVIFAVIFSFIYWALKHA